jgi:acetoin utilization protein AcuB
MVVEDRRLVGMLSDREMLRALSPYLGTVSEAKRDTATLNKRVHQVMELHPISATPDTDLVDIAGVFTEHQVECVPIINADREPIGMITWRDLLLALLPSGEQQPARA